MNSATFAPIFRLSLQNPREAAKHVIAMGLPERALWLALSLVVVLTSLVMSGILQAVPVPDDEISQVLTSSPGYNSPLLLTGIRLGQAVLGVYALWWIGRKLGGEGTIQDVLGVVTLLQVVSFVLLTGITIISLIFPLLSFVAFITFVGWLLWSVLTYVDEAHEFDNMFKAAGVVLVSMVVIVVGMSLLLGLLGGLFLGSTSGV
ncbi:MAG: Yip1 family protein [Pseudomonadota bacterium]